MPPRRPLFVHIGMPKTGTSYLQAALLYSRESLAEQGLDLVPPTKRAAFELMLLVRDRYDPDRDAARVSEALDRFSTLLAEAPGPRAVISQESLSAARPPQVRRFLEACEDREVHVIATVRDLARQLPSSWQQLLRGGGTTPYHRFLRRAKALEQEGSDQRPWTHLDLPAVLARWSEHVGPERIHVVTVPPMGSAPTTLLRRYCSVLGVDPERMKTEETRVNTSLGRVQAELLRRVNSELPPELRPRHVYGDLGKRFFAGKVLAAQEGSPIRLPPEFRGWCEEVTDRHIKTISAAGYVVTGTLEDLRCADAAIEKDAPPTEGEVGAVAVKALGHMLVLRSQADLQRAGRREARAGGPGGGRSLRIGARTRRLLRWTGAGTSG